MATETKSSTSFQDQLSAVMTQHQTAIQESRASAADAAKSLSSRWEVFDALVNRMREEVLRPSFLVLHEKFPSLTPAVVRDVDGARIVVQFPRDEVHPADSSIQISISRDEGFKNLLMTFRFGVLPLFIELEGEKMLTVPLDKPDMAAIKAWLDERLLMATKAYLSIEFSEHYQKRSLVIDPVIKESFPSHLAVGSIEHGGMKFHFKTEETMKMFKAEPDKFAKRM